MPNSVVTRALKGPSLCALKRNWSLYICEGIELALFMISACAFTIFLFDPSWTPFHFFPNAIVRRALLGVAMGITAVLIIHSPMGKRSGAHFNPAITLAYFRLGKIDLWDTVFYVFFQFVGGIFGVAVAAKIFGASLSKPAVEYVVTVPGPYGTGAAFFAEFFMAAVLMAIVLLLSNRTALAVYVSYSVGALLALYVLLFAPVSGVSLNPARTAGSAFFANIWTAGWLYFVAPLLGMIGAAEVYARFNGHARILCAKLHPATNLPCPFHCKFPGHQRIADRRPRDDRPGGA